MESCNALRAVFTGPQNPLWLETVSLPSPGAGQLRVQVLACALCTSDLHTCSGRRVSPAPSVLGHEAVGQVEVQGPGAPWLDIAGEPVRRGDRIVWSVAVSCGVCWLCQRGLPQKCERLFKYGHEPLSEQYPLSGGLASHILLEPGTGLVKIPSGVPTSLACLTACAGATVAAAIRAAGEFRGRIVLITGAGVLGRLASGMARSAGAAQVLAADPDSARAQAALSFGADHALAPDGVPGMAREISNGRGADILLEMSGSPEALEQGIQCLAIGGTAVLVGSVYPTRPIQISPETLVRRLLTLRGIHNYAPEDLRSAVGFLEQTLFTYPWPDLVSGSFPLLEIDAALASAQAAPPPPGRILVRPGTAATAR